MYGISLPDLRIEWTFVILKVLRNRICWIFIVHLWDSGRVIPKKNFSKKKVNTIRKKKKPKK